MASPSNQQLKKTVELKNDVDIWLIRDNLKLSYEDRVAQHQNTIDCVAELKQMVQKSRAKSTRTFKNTDS